MLKRWLWLLVALVAMALTIWAGYHFPALVPGRRRWDYVSLFLVPILAGLVSALPVVVFSLLSQAISAEEERARTLQLYLDRISTILVDHQVLMLVESAKRLGENYRDPLVESSRDLIKARTLSVLRVFSKDTERKSSVIRFLVESKILASLNLPLTGADLRCVDLRNARMPGAILAEADLRWADFRGADLRGADMSKADLRGADFRGADLREAQLSNIDLRKTKLKDACLVKAEICSSFLCRADLAGVNLTGASLFGSDLSQANLREAILRDARLIQADFGGANLSGSRLEGADFSSLRQNPIDLLMGGHLRRANLKGVSWDSKTRWPINDFLRNARNLPPDLKDQLVLDEDTRH